MNRARRHSAFNSTHMNHHMAYRAWYITLYNETPMDIIYQIIMILIAVKHIRIYFNNLENMIKDISKYPLTIIYLWYTIYL